MAGAWKSCCRIDRYGSRRVVFQIVHHKHLRGPAAASQEGPLDRVGTVRRNASADACKPLRNLEQMAPSSDETVGSSLQPRCNQRFYARFAPLPPWQFLCRDQTHRSVSTDSLPFPDYSREKPPRSRLWSKTWDDTKHPTRDPNNRFRRSYRHKRSSRLHKHGPTVRKSFSVVPNPWLARSRSCPSRSIYDHPPTLHRPDVKSAGSRSCPNRASVEQS